MAPKVKKPPASTGDERDAGSIPRLGRSPRVENDNPLQHSCLENSMDREPWGDTKGPWGGKVLDMTEQLTLSFLLHFL